MIGRKNIHLLVLRRRSLNMWFRRSPLLQSVFKFSTTLHEELMHMTRDFWWGDDNDRRHIHWLSWEKLMQREKIGRYGFQ